MEITKGQFVVEPSREISEFIEALNKLSFQNFPIDQVFKMLQNNPLPMSALEPYIFYSDIRYTRNLIHKSEDFELLLLCWQADQHSAIHGHEGEKCWMRVELGTLQFVDYQEEPAGNPTLLRKLNTREEQSGFVDGPAGVHQVSNTSSNRAISLHLYARPFDACDIYDLKTNMKTRINSGYQSIHGKLVALEK